MRAILAAVMMWATLSGGAGSAVASGAGAVDMIRNSMSAVTGHGGGYVSSWDGHRVSAQAMRQIW